MFIEDISEINPEALLCDGFDDAIIGIAERMGLNPVLAYSIDKIISIMMERDGMTYEEAVDYYEYNILGSWMGENSPIFIKTEC